MKQRAGTGPLFAIPPPQYPNRKAVLLHNYLKVAALGAVTALTLGASIGTAVAGVHNVHPHATTVCNNSSQPCTNISNLMLNQENGPDFVANATNLGRVSGSAFQGRKVNLRQASDTRTNEDFVIKYVGNLSQLCGSGTGSGVNSIDPTSYACLNYPDYYPVYQGQFAPNSNESGYCAGALAAVENFKIRLERCGAAHSFFVADLANEQTVNGRDYFPLEFAADSSASNPLVLTLHPNSTHPSNELFLNQENFSGGSVPDRQMFTLTGPAGSNNNNNR